MMFLSKNMSSRHAMITSLKIISAAVFDGMPSSVFHSTTTWNYNIKTGITCKKIPL